MPDTTIAQELALANVSYTQQKLRRAAARAAVSNPETADLATGVTVTMNTTADATLNRQYTAATTLPSVIYNTGGSQYFRAGNNGLYFLSGSYIGATAGNLGASAAPSDAPDANSMGYEVHILTAAPLMQFRQNGGVTTHGARVRVDGRYVTREGIVYPSGSSAITKVDFAGVRKMRHITLEGEFNVCLFSIDVDRNSEVSRALPVDRVVAVGLGDSLTEGLNNQIIVQQQSWFKRMARRVGWNDARIAAAGGTGYFRVASQGRLPIIQHLARWPVINKDTPPASVDVVTVFAGINDYVPFGSATQWSLTTPSGQTISSTKASDDTAYLAAVLATLQAVRATFPNALIIVLGVWPANYGLTADILLMENAIKSAVVQLADANSMFIPLSTAPSPLCDGTGRAGATTGNGTADVLVDTDALHPVPFGHDAITFRVEHAYRAWLNQLAA